MIFLLSLLAGMALAQAPAPDGAAVFQRSCASCHSGAADSASPVAGPS